MFYFRRRHRFQLLIKPSSPVGRLFLAAGQPVSGQAVYEKHEAIATFLVLVFARLLLPLRHLLLLLLLLLSFRVRRVYSHSLQPSGSARARVLLLLRVPFRFCFFHFSPVCFLLLSC